MSSPSDPDIPEPRLRVRGLRVRLGRSEVVRGVDLDVGSGEVLGVLGPSGAGKTTLFRALVGEIAGEAGDVHLDGVALGALPLWKRARLGLGYVPQTPSVLFDLTVGDNVTTYLRVLGAPSASRGAVEKAAHRVDLQDRLDVRARDLSGGERRRLELLRALLGEPAVLVCDEPFAGADPAAAKVIAQLLREHARSGAGIVIADHRVGEALGTCDRASLLVDGRVELTVAAADFATHSAVRRRYLG